MAKSIGAILSTVGAAALIATGVGAAAGLALFGTTAGISLGGVGLGTLLTASAALTAVGSFFTGIGQRAPKPDTTETSIKTPLPPRVDAFGESRLYGASILFETSSEGTTVDVYAFCEGPADAITGTYLNDDKVTVSGGVVQALPDKRYQGGRVLVGWTLGNAVETAFAAVIARLPSIWTPAHRGDGVVTGYLLKRPEKEKQFLETYPQGDSVQLSLVGRWKKVFDPRDPTQNPYDQSTWKWSDNAALALIWYLMVRRSYDWNARFAPQLPLLLAAINDCDSMMALKDGGSEKRYRTALSYRLTDEPAAIIASMLACFDGWFALNDAGEVLLYSGRYYPPTITLGPDQIAAYTHSSGTAVEDAVNEITIQYLSAEHDWKTVDASSWRDEDLIARSGREPNTADLGAAIPSYTQGRRLAKRMMARANASDRMTITTTFAGSNIVGQRYINVHLAEAGAVFYSGPVEITTPPERDMMTGGVTFDCVAISPLIDSWNPATEEGEAAPVGNRYAPEPLAAPTITSATVEFDGATDNGTGARIRIVTGALPPNVTLYARWRVGGTGPWDEQQYDDLDGGASAMLLTGFVPVAPRVQVAVEYRSADGRLSGYSPAFDVDTRTDITPPDAAASLTLVEWTDAMRLVTDRVPRATSYRWRFYDGTTLLRTVTTYTPDVVYASTQAAADGVRRIYTVDVAGVNGAGAGVPFTLSAISKPAPAAVTNPAIAGGATSATATCDAQAGATGYVLFYSNTAGFNPSTSGGVVTSGSPSIPVYGLAAGTYYGRIAAFDRWSRNPALLNLSEELSFTITTGGGSTPSGSGTGGGGYRGNEYEQIP